MLRLLKAPFINLNLLGLGTKDVFCEFGFVYKVVMFCMFLEIKSKVKNLERCGTKKFSQESL